MYVRKRVQVKINIQFERKLKKKKNNIHNTHHWNVLNILLAVNQHELCSSKRTAANTQETSGGMLSQHSDNKTNIKLGLQFVITLQSFEGPL